MVRWFLHAEYFSIVTFFIRPAVYLGTVIVPSAVDKRLQLFRSSPVDVARYSQLPHASAKTTNLPLDAAFDSHIGSNQGSNMLENVSITASSQRPYTYDADMAGANVRATAITWT